MPESHEYLPIKVVMPTDGDLRPPRGGGGTPKLFTEHFEESRSTLLNNLTAVEEYFDPAFSHSNLPAVARVNLRENALAKTHCPEKLFNAKTCPIIGLENFGEMLISLQPSSLKELTRTIRNSSTESLMNDVSKVISIEPFTASDAFGGWTAETMWEQIVQEGVLSIKLRLFTHRDQELDNLLIQGLHSFSSKHGIGKPQVLRYSPNLNIYKIQATRIEDLAELTSYVGTQGVDIFEQFFISAQSTPVAPMTEEDLPPPDPEQGYPLVGIIDSGTDPENSALQAWVECRDESLCPRTDQNNDHGSLVAGMIINAKDFNHGHPEFPSGQGKIVDIVALPSQEIITEDDLLESLRYAFETYPHVQLWNMSLNSKKTCRNEVFSSFAIALDSLQDEFGVLIINSAGNYSESPAHTWRRPDLSDRDRMLSPGDSLRAITVGSIAHIAPPQACAQLGEPSPFTRKGPGAAFVPKPDVSHFGGNTNQLLQYRQMGMLSVNSRSQIAETVGTSFAAPLVAITAAQLSNSFASPPSRHLLKAMIIHSAVLNSEEVTVLDLPYKGFGKPPLVEDILRCQPWESTLVFDLELPYSRRNFHKTHFPVPTCLHKDGKVHGEVIMTLVYDPPVDPNDGAAYSQVNINASLGVCSIVDGKEVYDRKIIPYPKNVSDMFEKKQIEHGFKWSPVKVFRKRMKGVTPRDMWRITLDMSVRKVDFAPLRQPVALVVTIRDPEKEQPVYNQAVAMMNQNGWITQNLRIKEQVRLRAHVEQ